MIEDTGNFDLRVIIRDKPYLLFYSNHDNLPMILQALKVNITEQYSGKITSSKLNLLCKIFHNNV